MTKYKRLLLVITAGLCSLLICYSGATSVMAQSLNLEKGVETVVTIQVAEANTSHVGLSFYRNFVGVEEEEYFLPLNTDGMIRHVFHLERPMSVWLRYGPELVVLYLEPGDDLQLSFNAKEISQSLQFNGKGRLHNRYLHQFQQRFGEWNEEFMVFEMLTKKPLEFKRSMDEKYRRKKEFFKSYHPSDFQSFSPDFRHYAMAEISYWWGEYLLRYRIEYAVSNGLNAPLALPFSYYQFLNQLLISNDGALANRRYFAFLNQYAALREEAPVVLKDTRFYSSQYVVKVSSLLLLAEPDEPPVLTEIPKGEPLKDLNKRSAFASRFMIGDSMQQSHWKYVETAEGQRGWVIEKGLATVAMTPLASAYSKDYPVVKFLSGKTLHHFLATTLFWSQQVNPQSQANDKLKAFLADQTFPEYHTLFDQSSLQTIEKPAITTAAVVEEKQEITPNIEDTVIASVSVDSLASKALIQAPSTASQAPPAKEEKVSLKVANERIRRSIEARTKKKEVNIPVLPVLNKSIVHLEGQLQEIKYQSLELVLYDNPIEHQERVIPLKINGEGLLQLDLEVEGAATVGYLRHNQKEWPVYFRAGQSYQLDFKASDVLHPLQLVEATYQDNAYLAKQAVILKDFKEKLQKAFKEMRNPMAFKRFMEEGHSKRLAFLKQYQKQHVLHPQFLEYARNEIDYWFANQLFNYRWEHPLLNDKEAPIKVPSAFYSFLDGLVVHTSGAFPSSEFTYFLDQYIPYLKNLQPDLTDREIAENYLSGNALTYFLTRWYARKCRQGKTDEYGMPIQLFIATCQNEQYQHVLRQVYNECKSLNNGMKAPEFELLDLNGQQVRLQDFNGKVVYLDFWASWCQPCRQQLRNSREWKKQFNEEEVAFVYISLDKETIRWKSTVQSENLSGIQLHAAAENIYQSPVARLYKVNRLPATFVIDQQGKIQYNSYEDSGKIRISDQIMSLLSIKEPDPADSLNR